MPPLSHSTVHIVPPQYQYGLDRSIANLRGSIPSATQHSLLLHSGRSAPIIDNLEDAASQTPQSNPPVDLPQAQPPASTSLTERPTKKRKRTAEHNKSASPQSTEVLLQKSYDELFERALDEDETDESIVPEEPGALVPSGQMVGSVTAVLTEASLKNDYHCVQRCVND
ncbi:hypothetical protein PtA15_8A590 [Puccinia triticina]|uniref:Uncharacterized protein n=1 Tax=Puccinia triticina TaxID=208348 RepID=A0ABY7CSP4_9BASI|nr:uncharacterized protein PtA15_8A590 [Puccinia triticina]WAQ87684.1 hypothetical protein PtA15_8A590 [Puccinia triticina]